jgi:aspartate racemase
VAARASIPLLSIVEATARAAKALRLEHVGLLGTRFTMEGGFYAEVFGRLGLSLVVPSDADLAWIHEVYVAELVNGQFRAETRRRMTDVILRLREDAGIDGVVLGGTELPLLLRGEDPEGVRLLDTTSIHVDEAVAELLRRG